MAWLVAVQVDGIAGVMACQRVSRAVMTARFSQASRISALEPNG